MLKNRLTYEIMTPESVGRQEEDMVLGKHSGRAALVKRLGDLGYRLDEDQIDIVFTAMKSWPTGRRKFCGRSRSRGARRDLPQFPDKYRLEYLSAISGNMAIPNAVVKMYVDGEERVISDFGTGPIDAVFSTIAKVVERSPKLVRYAVNAITGGTDAQGEVTVKIEENGKTHQFGSRIRRGHHRGQRQGLSERLEPLGKRRRTPYAPDFSSRDPAAAHGTSPSPGTDRLSSAACRWSWPTI